MPDLTWNVPLYTRIHVFNHVMKCDSIKQISLLQIQIEFFCKIIYGVLY